MDPVPIWPGDAILAAIHVRHIVAHPGSWSEMAASPFEESCKGGAMVFEGPVASRREFDENHGN